MSNLITSGDFRISTIDIKVGVGAGTIPASSAAVGPWTLSVDESDATSGKYVRIRNLGVSAAVAAGKVSEPPAQVIGDSLLLFDAEAGSLGSTRVGFAKVYQAISSSPKALSNLMTELNLFVYAAVAGTFGVDVANINVYAGGTLITSIINESIQLQVGWNRIRRVFLHPNVLDTDPVQGAYVSGSHQVILCADQGGFNGVNINQSVTFAITGVYFGPASAEFDRVEEITRANIINLVDTVGVGVPTGGSTGQVLAKNSGTSFDTGWITNHPIPAGGTTGQVLEKNSGTDYDASWATPATPSGLAPTGGTTGQVLEKNSNTNYDYSWTTPATPSGLLPTGGTVGQVLKKNSSTNYDDNFANLLGTNSESTTTGAISLDLTPGKEIDRVVLTGNPTFSTTNRANGLFKSIRIDSNGSSRTLSFTSGWVWLGTDNSAGVTLASGKSAVLSLTCYGTNETDIVACYVAQP